MGKKNKVKAKGRIKTTAVVNSVKIGVHEDKLSLTGFSLTPAENEVVTDIIQSESPISLTIDLVKPDKDFPKIEVQGMMKQFTINKTCDSPGISGIQFSTGQVGQLTNYIRAEEELSLVIVQLQQELPFEEDGKK